MTRAQQARLAPIIRECCPHGIPLVGAGMCHYCQAEEPEGLGVFAPAYETLRRQRGSLADAVARGAERALELLEDHGEAPPDYIAATNEGHCWIEWTGERRHVEITGANECEKYDAATGKNERTAIDPRCDICTQDPKQPDSCMCGLCWAEMERCNEKLTLSQEWEDRQKRGSRVEPFGPVEGIHVCGECKKSSDSCWIGGSGSTLCYPCLVSKRGRESYGYVSPAKQIIQAFLIVAGVLAVLWLAAVANWGAR